MENVVLSFLIITLVVGIVTAFLNIRFDRFFVILMLFMVGGFTIRQSINIGLFIILFGALVIIYQNFDNILLMLNKKKSILITTPTIVLIFSLLGTYLYMIYSDSILIFTLGILALLYGFRLTFVHFNEMDFRRVSKNIGFQKFCSFVGPAISGFSLGFIGTSLKPLKIPFGVKLGKLNMKQVYVGNVITAFYATIFTIVFHSIASTKKALIINYNFLIIALALWISIHITSEITNRVIKDEYRMPFQVLIGIILIFVSFKLFIISKIFV